LGKKSYSSEVLIPVITILSDILAIFLSYIISYYLRFYSSLTNFFPFEGEVPPLSGYLELCLMVIPVWILIFQSRKMYRSHRIVFILDEFFLISRLVTFGIIFSFGLIFFYRVFPYSRLVFVLIWAVSIVLITLGRYFVLKIEKNLYNKGKALDITVIAGNNETSADIYDNFLKHPYAGYKVVGYIDEDNYNDENFLKGKPKLGSFSQISEIIKKYKVRTVLVSIPSNEHDKLFELMKLSEGENVNLLLVPDFLEMITSSVRVQEVDGIPFLKIKSIPMNIWNTILKRLFDIIFASAFLLLISPLFIIIAILVKLTSPGKIFYYQERVSLAGRKFQMIKFRSMVEGAEKSTGAIFASKNDERSTPIGKFLRKFSLDELPQFINVIKGDMSIVGPRPEREFFINIMKQKIPKYLERHRVKCGITGWAQVNGLRGGETSLEKRIEYDIYFIENWSIIFDLKIIFKTIREMFFSKAAF
jgi:exopolysaccharide biosynthesis polyprenyl glycosylphosphotransferase